MPSEKVDHHEIIIPEGLLPDPDLQAERDRYREALERIVGLRAPFGIEALKMVAEDARNIARQALEEQSGE